MSVPDEDFASLLDSAMPSQSSGGGQLKSGAVVDGTIVQIGKDTIFLDVGTRSEGQISRDQLADKEGNLKYKLGDRIRATVASGGDRPKLVMSMGRGAVNSRDLELAHQAGTPVNGTVTGIVKGGLEVEVGGVRAFCPASQFERTFTQDLTPFEGQSFNFRVLEVRDGGRSVVLSRRVLLEAERAEQSQARLSELAVGQDVEGTVQSIQAYGAFVDIGGIDGMIHISQLGAGRVEQVSDVLQVGETVNARVMSIDPPPEDKPNALPRVGLSMRAMIQGDNGTRPTKEIEILEGKVLKVEQFGVFVATSAGEGIIPMRELELPPGADPRRSLPAGKVIEVVKMRGTNQNGQPRFSAKGVDDARARSDFQAFRADQAKADKKNSKSMGSLGALLQQRLGSVSLPEETPSAAPAAAQPQSNAGGGKRHEVGRRRR